jgi:ABC-2 type transport system ATP-binding protein
VISARNLTKRYAQNVAVDNLSLEVESGQFFGLLGPNGSGKTTTIHMLSTLLKPSEGSILINGIDVSQNPREVRRQIGLVFQESALDRTLSVEENLLFCAGLHGLKKHQVKERISALLELFSLENKKSAPVASLSGGMRRSVDIIRGVLHQPKILFLDEPTVGLDIQSRRRIWHFIQRLIQDQSLTVILTTHYLEEATPCDVTSFIKAGRVVSSGTPDSLIKEFAQLVVEVECDNPDVLLKRIDIPRSQIIADDSSSILIRVLDDEKSDLEKIQTTLSEGAMSFKVRKPNLNDVFLWLTNRREGQGT